MEAAPFPAAPALKNPLQAAAAPSLWVPPPHFLQGIFESVWGVSHLNYFTGFIYEIKSAFVFPLRDSSSRDRCGLIRLFTTCAVWRRVVLRFGQAYYTTGLLTYDFTITVGQQQ